MAGSSLRTSVEGHRARRRAGDPGRHGRVPRAADSARRAVAGDRRRRAPRARARPRHRGARRLDRRPPAPATVAAPPPASGRRQRIIAMPGKTQTDIAYGFTTVSRLDPALLRLLDDEQRPRAVRPGRPARRQHPRAAGDGVLRVQHARSGAGRGAAAGSRRGRSGQRRVGRSPRSITRSARSASTDRPRPNWPRPAPTWSGRFHGSSKPIRASPRFCRRREEYGLGLDFDQRLPPLLDTVTLEEMHAAAAEVLDPARAAVAVAGPDD